MEKHVYIFFALSHCFPLGGARCLLPSTSDCGSRGFLQPWSHPEESTSSRLKPVLMIQTKLKCSLEPRKTGQMSLIQLSSTHLKIEKNNKLRKITKITIFLMVFFNIPKNHLFQEVVPMYRLETQMENPMLYC